MTLADFGVVAYDICAPEEELPKLELIKECEYWEDVQDILTQNRKTHPADRIWILNNGKFRVMREK